MSTAVAKCSLSVSDAFLRGVVCNILVCVAVWLALSSRSVPGKVLGFICLSCFFVVSGFEHSVANMYYVPVALLARIFRRMPVCWKGSMEAASPGAAF